MRPAVRRRGVRRPLPPRRRGGQPDAPSCGTGPVRRARPLEPAGRCRQVRTPRPAPVGRAGQGVVMHALFFEMRPHPGHMPHYFAHVARLRPVLERHAGLIFLERYAACDTEEVLLSHQLWRSEAAIVGWRADAAHRKAQTAGRQVHFADYRIRVGARVLHWQADAAAPASATGADGDAAGDPAAPHVLALYGTRRVTAPGLAAFESVTRPGRFIALASLAGRAAARAALRAHVDGPGLEVASVYAIRRDYGLTDRAQAPG